MADEPSDPAADGPIADSEIRECAIRLMENDGSIESGWTYRELREHEEVFSGIIRGLLNREYNDG